MKRHKLLVTSSSLALILAMLTSASALAQEKNPERNVYYGETHLHTSWSFDAYAFGDTQTGPEEFYQYALGKPTMHPGGCQVTITKPLDWVRSPSMRNTWG
jgi:hypothetical protein